jgi:hypothetical protein
MINGYNTFGGAAATLFGVLLVATAFCYYSAFKRLNNVAAFKSFTSWVFPAILGCFVYFSYGFLVSLDVVKTTYSFSNLLGLTIVATALLIAFHIVETLRLRRLCGEDWQLFQKLFWSLTLLMSVVFIVFVVFSWRAVLAPSAVARYHEVSTVFWLTLIMVSFRAVSIVWISIYMTTILSKAENNDSPASSMSRAGTSVEKSIGG